MLLAHITKQEMMCSLIGKFERCRVEKQPTYVVPRVHNNSPELLLVLIMYFTKHAVNAPPPPPPPPPPHLSSDPDSYMYPEHTLLPLLPLCLSPHPPSSLPLTTPSFLSASLHTLLPLASLHTLLPPPPPPPPPPTHTHTHTHTF